MNSKDFKQRFQNTLLLRAPSSDFFLQSVTERLSSKGHPVPVAKEFDKYLKKNLIFKKVTDTQLEFHKN